MKSRQEGVVTWSTVVAEVEISEETKDGVRDGFPTAGCNLLPGDSLKNDRLGPAW